MAIAGNDQPWRAGPTRMADVDSETLTATFISIGGFRKNYTHRGDLIPSGFSNKIVPYYYVAGPLAQLQNV